LYAPNGASLWTPPQVYVTAPDSSSMDAKIDAPWAAVGIALLGRGDGGGGGEGAAKGRRDALHDIRKRVWR